MSPALGGLGLRVSEPLVWGTVPPLGTVDIGWVTLWGGALAPLDARSTPSLRTTDTAWCPWGQNCSPGALVPT